MSEKHGGPCPCDVCKFWRYLVDKTNEYSREHHGGKMHPEHIVDAMASVIGDLAAGAPPHQRDAWACTAIEAVTLTVHSHVAIRTAQELADTPPPTERRH